MLAKYAFTPDYADGTFHSLCHRPEKDRISLKSYTFMCLRKYLNHIPRFYDHMGSGFHINFGVDPEEYVMFVIIAFSYSLRSRIIL